MAGLDIRLNGQTYALKASEDGTKIVSRPVRQFVQPIRQTGRTRPQDVSPYETFIHPNMSYGFGRYRINSDAAFEPKEYRRFWDSTCDTRWMDAVYLPIQSEDSTHTGLEVIRSSANFLGELNGMWEDGTSTTVVNRQYTGGSTTWENGGTIIPTVLALVSETTEKTGGATGITEPHTIADNSLRLIVAFSLTRSAPPGGGSTGTTSVTYDGIPLTFAATVDSNDQSYDISVWYLINPPVGTADVVSTYNASAEGALQIFDFKNADIGTPLRTVASEGASGSGTYTADLAPTTVAGDIVVDFIQADYSATLTVGAGQTQVANDETGSSSGHAQFASSHETASGVSTTMSWTVSTNDHGLMAVPVVGTTPTEVVGLDMIPHKNKLVALGVQGKSHVISTSTDGATWKGIPSSQKLMTDLDGAVSTTDTTTVVVTSAAELSIHDTILVEDEQMHITAIATHTLTVERGYNGTTAATHADEDIVTVMNDIQHSLLSNVVTANEDIDAGLLLTLGDELVAAVWDEVGKVIRFYSTSDVDENMKWVDQNVRISSSRGPLGICAYPDIDRVLKIYVATYEGIYVIDPSGTDWDYQLIFPMTGHGDNGRRMTIHNGSIWIAQGVGNTSPASIYKLTVQGDRRLIESGFGLSTGDSVPSDMMGSVSWMKSAGDILYMSVGGHSGSTKSRVLAHNSLGWHHMTQHTTANQPIEWIDFSGDDDATPRLHYAIRTGTAVSNAKFLGEPNVNPRSGVSIKREDDSDNVVGYLDLPYIDLGMPHESKAWLRGHVNADDLNSSAADEYIAIEYGTDNAARTTTALGNFTSATTANTFASNAGVSAVNIGMRVHLLRGSTVANTPKLKDITVEAMVVPGNGNVMYQHEFNIDISQTASTNGLSSETVYSNLKTLLASIPQVDLEFGGESRKVTVDRESAAFLTSFDDWTASGSPNTLMSRKGYLRLTVTERIPLS